MKKFLITFRVRNGDVFEVPVFNTTYEGAFKEALEYFGLHRTQVIFCLDLTQV